ncbi:hypothetical protein BCR33DRAFT_752392 [Rhizoclosmatium globosum]|uniref:C2H2-type domain-containing protein n=1 Tax=Rhizoclosmatium globosum TaxID=329046 RepID=A0A1Y1ZJT8_9FUNG|nr:hypothetical protein BCR33DRAFT_752392 [Rhizoclosmatium globosum]|eukprot:ORY10085.1 hypothetical protein BCR33DRAFT_752392 [Rhizoclosmatium globosum]
MDQEESVDDTISCSDLLIKGFWLTQSKVECPNPECKDIAPFNNKFALGKHYRLVHQKVVSVRYWINDYTKEDELTFIPRDSEDNLFHCNKCNLAVDFPEKLQSHVKKMKCGLTHPARFGFMCLDCNYVCVSQSAIRVHCRAEHQKNQYWGYRPTQVVKLYARVFGMYKPEEGFDARQRAKELKSLARKQKQIKNTAGSRSKAYLSTGLETAGLIASSSKTNTPFLNNMGWDKLVFGIDAIKNPAKYIAILTETKDTKTVIMLCRLFLEKVNELATLPATQPTRTAIKNAGRKSTNDTGYAGKAFKPIDVKGTIPAYARTLGLFVTMLIARKQGANTGTKMPKLRDDVNEAVEALLETLDVPLLCRTNAVIENQQEALIKLLRIVLFEDIGFEGLDTGRIHLVEEYLLLRFLQPDGTFCKEQLMTGPCTHFLFASRCLVLDWCQEIASFGSWMARADKDKEINQVIELVSYGKHSLPYAKMKQFKSTCGLIMMGSNTANLISKHWDYSLPNEPKLVIDGRLGVSKTMFREGRANYFRVITTELSNLLFGMDVSDFTFDPKWLTDNVANSRPGYSFMTEQANSSAFSEENGNRLELHIKKTKNLRIDFFEPTRLIYKTEAMESYTAKVDNFISLLMLGLALFCGMPPRTTEFQMTTIVNSGLGKRNLMILEHRLCINLRYNKSSANSGFHKDLFRFVPDELAQILVKYLVFVYPLYIAFWADMRNRKKLTFLTHEDEIQAKTYLFLRNRIPCKVSKLHGLYIQNFWSVFGVNLEIRHTGQMMASFADHIDFEETAVAEVNTTVSSQFGHSSQVHQNNYGATTDGAAVIRKMKSISDKWWKWCSLTGEGDSSLYAAGLQIGSGSGSRSDSRVIEVDLDGSNDSEAEGSEDGSDSVGDTIVEEDADNEISEEGRDSVSEDNHEIHERESDADFNDESPFGDDVLQLDGGISDGCDSIVDSEEAKSTEVTDQAGTASESTNDTRLHPRYPREFNDPALANFYSMIYEFLDDHAEVLGYNNTPSEDEAWATDYDNDDDDE